MEEYAVCEIARDIGREFVRNMTKVFIGVKDTVSGMSLRMIEDIVKSDVLMYKSGCYRVVLEMLIDGVIVECDKEYDVEKVVGNICRRYAMQK